MKKKQVGTEKEEIQPLKLANVSRLFLLTVLICRFQACQKHRFGPSILRRQWIFMAAHVASRHRVSAGSPSPRGLGQRWRGTEGPWTPPLPRAGVGEAKLKFWQCKRVENSTRLGWRGWGGGVLPRIVKWKSLMAFLDWLQLPSLEPDPAPFICLCDKNCYAK